MSGRPPGGVGFPHFFVTEAHPMQNLTYSVLIITGLCGSKYTRIGTMVNHCCNSLNAASSSGVQYPFFLSAFFVSSFNSHATREQSRIN